MRSIAVALVAIMLAITPAAASQCVPLPAIGAQIQAAGITAADIFATEDVSFVDLYTKALGVGIPDDAEPVGLLLVRNGDRVLVSLVERDSADAGQGYCVRYTAIVPLAAHQAAFVAASRQA